MGFRNWFVALCFFTSFPCQSATISSDGMELSLVGAIKRGDSAKLRKLIKLSENGIASITLDSSGGEVLEAIKIAETIRPLYILTTVAKGKLCASACFFIWLAGSPRVGGSTAEVEYFSKSGTKALGLVGLHRPYLDSVSRPSQNQHQAMRQVQNYLESQMVSRRLIDLLMSRPSNDIYWMTDDDFEELGEYRPEVEEFLIKRCGYVRPTFRAFIRDSGKAIAEAEMCTNALTLEMNQKAFAHFKNNN